jgi:methionine biosynthesis protein MetW
MLYDSLRKIAKQMAKSAIPYTYGRHHFKSWVRQYVEEKKLKQAYILDIGCGKGDDLINVSQDLAVDTQLFGIEYYSEYRSLCIEKGITAVNCNIEQDALPFDSQSMDVVMINQVIEHTKDTFWCLSEISRVLKPNGILLLGIPNLAAWHDRFALLLGQQPTSIHFPGPHVRGITKRGMITFTELDGYFKLLHFKGSAFYPLPGKLGQFFARFFPSLATSIFFCFKKTEKEGLYIDVLKSRFYETNYYQGPDPT